MENQSKYLFDVWFLAEYFSEAKDGFMKELVDFNDRNDFDRYMSSIENSYFDKVAKVSKMPY